MSRKFLDLHQFVDFGADSDTLEYLLKSQPLNKTGLVQKEVQVTGKDGHVFVRKQWVKASEYQPQHNSTVVKKPDTRKVVDSTPVGVTDATSHLVPLVNLGELPEHLKGRVPPDYREVLVSTDPNASLLCAARDSQNRIVYVYHEDFVKERQTEKFNRVKQLMSRREELENVIKFIRESDKDSGDCLELMYKMGLRPGSTRNTKAKVQAYGATTLQMEHVVVDGDSVYLDFIGKKGVRQRHEVTDDSLKSMLLNRKESQNSGDLFPGTNDSKLRELLKVMEIHPRDLRTMLATSTAIELLSELPQPTNLKEFRKMRLQVADVVCSKLGNDRAMSLKAYINPECFRDWSPEWYQRWIESGGK